MARVFWTRLFYFHIGYFNVFLHEITDFSSSYVAANTESVAVTQNSAAHTQSLSLSWWRKQLYYPLQRCVCVCVRGWMMRQKCKKERNDNQTVIWKAECEYQEWMSELHRRLMETFQQSHAPVQHSLTEPSHRLELMP